MAETTRSRFAFPSIRKYFNELGTEEIFPYAPEAGVPAFREAWKKWILHKSGSLPHVWKNRCYRRLSFPVSLAGISICTRHVC